ncbi:MAG: hypothetical protein ACK5PB_21075, partial [Pirellula sp.]
IRYYVPLSSHAKRQLIRSVASPYLREISSVNPHAAVKTHITWMALFWNTGGKVGYRWLLNLSGCEGWGFSGTIG